MKRRSKHRERNAPIFFFKALNTRIDLVQLSKENENLEKMTETKSIYAKGYKWNIYRSSHQRCSVRKGIFRDFAKFTVKYLCQSLFFNKVAGRPATLLKKRLWHKYFTVNFAKSLKMPFLTEHLWWLLLYIFHLYPLAYMLFVSVIFSKFSFSLDSWTRSIRVFNALKKKIGAFLSRCLDRRFISGKQSLGGNNTLAFYNFPSTVSNSQETGKKVRKIVFMGKKA